MGDGDNWPRHGLYMTGSSNDECEGRQQVDRRVGYCNSFLPFYHSVSPHNNILLVLKGLRNMEIFSVSRLSPSPSILPLCVRAYAQHNCSISSGFSLCYPFKKKEKRHSKQDLGYHCPGETLCWQQTFFMQAAQKLETQSAVQQEKSRQLIVLWKQKKSKSIQKWSKRLQFQDMLQH